MSSVELLPHSWCVLYLHLTNWRNAMTKAYFTLVSNYQRHDTWYTARPESKAVLFISMNSNIILDHFGLFCFHWPVYQDGYWFVVWSLDLDHHFPDLHVWCAFFVVFFLRLLFHLTFSEWLCLIKGQSEENTLSCSAGIKINIFSGFIFFTCHTWPCSCTRCT